MPNYVGADLVKLGREAEAAEMLGNQARINHAALTGARKERDDGEA